jgi:alpha-L-rhamnosidase
MDTLVTAADGTWHIAPIAGPNDLAFILPGYFEDRTWVGASFIGSYASMPRGPITFQPMPPQVMFPGSLWIWTNEGTNLPGQARAFRHTFNPPAGLLPIYATIIVTCDNSYAFWLNGNFIAVSPTETDWTVAQRYVLPLIPGANVFAFVGFNADVGPTPAGLLARVQVQLVNSTGPGGSTLITFGTDSTWLTLNGQSPPLNFEFSAFNDSGWSSATAYAGFGGGPWGSGITVPPLT